MPPRNKRKRVAKDEPFDFDSDNDRQDEPKRVKAECGVKSEEQDVKIEELSGDDFVIELNDWEMSGVVSSDDDTERRPVRRSAGGRPPRRGVDIGRLYEEVGVGQLARSLGQVVKEEARVGAAAGVKEEEGGGGEQRSPLRVSDYVRRAAAMRAEQLLQGTDHSFITSAAADLTREKRKNKHGNRFTEEQRVALLDQFATNSYPNRQTKEELSRSLGVGYMSVENWFRDERRRRGNVTRDRARERCQFGPEIYDELVAQFEEDPNPDLATRRSLAEKADATVVQISKWFENRRRRQRYIPCQQPMQITPKLRKELLTVFDANPYPDRATKEALAEKVGCSFHQLVDWFNHRRRSVGLRENSEEFSRRICQFGPEGYDKLMAQFEAGPNPDRVTKVALAGQVGGTLQQITEWFKNRRERKGIRGTGNSARQKCSFGPAAYDKLVAAFEVDPFPDRATRQALATMAGGTPKQISDWFARRRRSQGIRVEDSFARNKCAFGPKMYDQLVTQFEVDPHPDLATRRALAENAGATVERISRWFRARRRRVGVRQKTPAQLCKFGCVIYDKLVTEFDTDPYPSKERVEHLAQKLGLTPLQVRRWFSDRRARQPKVESSLEPH